MRYARILALVVIGLASGGYAHAQSVHIGIGFGGPRYVSAPPACRYGYYDYAPYACAPYGYYGPTWFADGVFIGAGPWYRSAYYGRGYDERPAFYGGTYYRRAYRPEFVERGYGRGYAGGYRDGGDRNGSWSGREERSRGGHEREGHEGREGRGRR